MINRPGKIRAIVTGATGMVGEGVLHECLMHPDVEAVLVLSRKSIGFTHPKMKEVLHQDFFDLSAVADQLTGYNACFFCLGVSSVGMKEDAYFKMTYTLTMHVAETLSSRNSDMTFCYVSGAGTDSTEKGRSMWARIKGKTENDLLKLPFAQAYNFRPGIIEPTKGLKNTHWLYNYLGWLIYVIRAFAPKSVCSLRQIGLAMIRTVTVGYSKQTLEIKDIMELSGVAK